MYLCTLKLNHIIQPTIIQPQRQVIFVVGFPQPEAGYRGRKTIQVSVFYDLNLLTIPRLCTCQGCAFSEQSLKGFIVLGEIGDESVSALASRTGESLKSVHEGKRGLSSDKKKTAHPLRYALYQNRCAVM